MLSAFLLLLGLESGCTRAPSGPDLPVGRPALSAAGAPAPESITRIEISARLPSISPWNARIEKEDGVWRITSRSDRPEETAEPADSARIDHLLEVLSTFSTESSAGTGEDSGFGLDPYRMEFRLSDGKTTTVLRLGDPSGTYGIFFRIGRDEKESRAKTWVGRGALIQTVPSIGSPDSLVNPSPFFASPGSIESLRLKKLRDPGRSSWSFVRDSGRWLNGGRPIGEEKTALLERLLHQRISRVVPETGSADRGDPDWTIEIRSPSGEEKLSVVFSLNRVLGRNPSRSTRTLELYPEFAGTLRAFTQARFTADRSGTE
jgi:hypothetical protein